MNIIDIPTERTTALTDLILGLVVIGLLLVLYSLRNRENAAKVDIWLLAFGFLGFASMVGVVAHGLAMSPEWNNRLWQPLNLALGLAIAMFVLGAVFDLWGKSAYRKVRWPMIGAGVAFYLVTVLFPDTFLTFIIYEVIAMLFAFAGYLYLAIQKRLMGAWWMVAGIAITIAAAAVQAVGENGRVLFWGLDHNGVFHLIQIVGVLALFIGLRASLATGVKVRMAAAGLLLALGLAAGFAPGRVSGAAGAVAACPALPAPGGRIVNVSTVAALENAVNSAISGDTIRVANGVYNLNGIYLRIDTPNVTLRSVGGDREAVILDGNYLTTEIIQVAASNVTIADLTLREAYYHPIHVMSGDAAHTLNTLIYNVHIIDPGEQAIKINPAASGYYADSGTIACSHIELTDAGRGHIRNNCYTGGVDAHQARGWTIRDNVIEGFWCAAGLSEHAIHMWRGCRDTVIERNVLRDNARGIGLGLVTSGEGRTYADNPCPAASGYVDDFGGMVRNNFIAANDGGLFASDYGFDCGICLWNACNAQALHNSVYTANTGSTFSAIEWRFPNTQAQIGNNLANDTLRERDGAHGVQNGNLSTAQASWFAAAASGDLHLAAGAAQAIDQVTAPAGVTDDVDGDPRPSGASADIGADEYGLPAPGRVNDLRVTHAVVDAGSVTITLRWAAAANASLIALRYAAAPITAANWSSAAVLDDALPGDETSYTAVLPYSGGTLYFALKTQGETGLWSALSNNAFWPRFDGWLPLLVR